MNARQQLTGLKHYWLPFTPNRYFQEHPKILASAKGAYYTTRRRPQTIRLPVGPVVLPRRARASENCRGTDQASADTRLLARVSILQPDDIEPGRPRGRDGAGRTDARVLHQLRLGSGADSRGSA